MKAILSLVISLITLTACQSLAPGGIVSPLVQPGSLQGHVNIGPLTPVERAGVPTATVPPQVYAARQLVLYKEDGTTEISRIKLNDQGDYRVELAPGTYVLGLVRSGIDRTRELPATVTITSGATTTVDVSIDTGIR